MEKRKGEGFDANDRWARKKTRKNVIGAEGEAGEEEIRAGRE